MSEAGGDAPGSPRCLCCGAVLAGRFCASCGQRGDTRRLELRALVARFVGAFASLDGPLLRTATDLFVRPGAVVSDYVRGRRIVYVNPVQWAILTSGATALIGHTLSRVGPVRIQTDGSMPAWLRTALEELGSNAGPLYVLVLLPLLAVAMRLCFRQRGGTIAEHLVHVLFCYGIGTLLQIVWAGAVAGFGAPPGPAGLLPVAWTVWAAVGAHPERRPLIAVLLALLAHFVWMLLLVGIGLVAFGVCWLLGLVE